ncbi:hypothetical protein SUDANB1_00004 [Streptomyces sp. enrichment culture]|uniref:hypothetical protein n=1 Tax=Streptomyces sp. enrichment culture TaxID=1795815 RepID=UPI003F57FD18
MSNPTPFDMPHFGENGTVCQSDNASVSYYMDSGGANKLEDDDKRVVRDVIASEYGPTDLAFSYDSTPSWSGDSETDIYYSEASVPGSAQGITFCNAVAPRAYRCDQQYVRIEGGGHYTPGLACHETGHAFGLLHGNRSYPQVGMQDNRLGCMKKSRLRPAAGSKPSACSTATGPTRRSGCRTTGWDA